MNLFLVGDSTVCYYDNESDRYIPRHGYGMHVDEYLNDVCVRNLALSGRSSRSFLKEPEYSELLAELSAGDFLAVAFGHNDEKHDERYTNPNFDISEPLGFKYHLYNFYIKPAVQRGANVILCTPICRLDEKNLYTGRNIHVVDSFENFEGGDYSQAIRELAKELNVPLLDMTEYTAELYKNSGYERAKLFHATNSSDKNDIDGTHLNNYGASYLAYLFAKALQKTDCPLKNSVKFDIKPPVMEIFHN